MLAANIFSADTKRPGGLGLGSKVVLFFGNWIRQGITYVDRTERVFKISIDLALTGLFFCAFFLGAGWSVAPSVVSAFLIAHTLNWLFNGHFWALIMELELIKMRNSPQKVLGYAQGMQKRLSSRNCVLAVAVYGSISREKLTETSDLDVRILRKPGLVNGFFACFLALSENVRAVFSRFPLDLHVADNTGHLANKIRQDEPPVILCDQGGALKDFYQGRIVDFRAVMARCR